MPRGATCSRTGLTPHCNVRNGSDLWARFLIGTHRAGWPLPRPLGTRPMRNGAYAQTKACTLVTVQAMDRGTHTNTSARAHTPCTNVRDRHRIREMLSPLALALARMQHADRLARHAWHALRTCTLADSAADALPAARAWSLRRDTSVRRGACARATCCGMAERGNGAGTDFEI